MVEYSTYYNTPATRPDSSQPVVLTVLNKPQAGKLQLMLTHNGTQYTPTTRPPVVSFDDFVLQE